MYARTSTRRKRGGIDFQAEILQHPRKQIPLFFVRVKQTENCGTVYSEKEGEGEREREGDETRATFAPVHRPQPPQIVKSCLQLSEILIFPDESFPRFLPTRLSLFFFLFFREEALESSTVPRLYYIIFCQTCQIFFPPSSNFKVNDNGDPCELQIISTFATLLSSKRHRESRKAYFACFILVDASQFSSLFRVIQRSCPHAEATKFCRLIEKFSRVQSHELATVITLVPPAPRHTYALNQGFLIMVGIEATFPRFISRNDGIEQSLINFNSPFCSG